jgi:DNA mismatch repair ATPase MutL
MAKKQAILPSFGLNFLKDHAGRIINDPGIALIELVANSWDAGSDSVKIIIPDKVNEKIVIFINE